MVFSSTIFLFIFLPLTLSGYYLMKDEIKNYWLFFASLIFFGWSQLNYLWIILLNILINYLCAMLIDRSRKFRRAILISAIVANLAILFFFKYYDFVIDSINKIVNLDLNLLNIALPIGISFFTFQGLSYVVDVYRNDVPAQKSILKVGLYIVLFPQLVAGPIVRYKDIAIEINERKTTLDDFSSGIERFIIGLAKKVIIANTMATVVDTIWNNNVDNYTCSIVWAGSIAYTLQIYFDFSGYSDMAIGLGRMFGFHFNENFNLPYESNSISEFWRRWHISLSSWFRDYIYIPLGGNKKNVIVNLSVVFLLTGIWHGASWHFVIWGIWNLLFIILERIFKFKKFDKCKDTRKPVALIISRIYTLAVVNFGWVLFRAPSTVDAFRYIAAMFGIIESQKAGFTFFWYFNKWTVAVLIVGILFASSIPGRIGKALKQKLPGQVFDICKYVLLIGIMYLSMLRIVAGTYNPFIYFQF